jgi:hypothetical protein
VLGDQSACSPLCKVTEQRDQPFLKIAFWSEFRFIVYKGLHVHPPACFALLLGSNLAECPNFPQAVFLPCLRS